MSTHASAQGATLAVRFTIERPPHQPVRIVKEPERIMVWYAYDREHTPEISAERPHELVLVAAGLQRNETLEIHLVSTRRIADVQTATALLHSIFPNAGVARHGFGWEIPYGTDPVSSGPAWSAAGNVGAFEVEYRVRLYRGGREVASVDPDINLIPDP